MVQNQETKLIQRLIGKIDYDINQQVNAILHHSEFQKMESAWRGVLMVVDAAAGDKKVVVRLLNISLRELYKDMTTAIEFDQSQLYKKVYSNEFDQPGGEPYGLIVGNYTFSHKPTKDVPDPVSLLHNVAKVAASAFTPFVAAASPHIFGIDCFSELKVPFKMDDIFKTLEYQRWKGLQQQEETRYLGLVLPRMLMRRPYNANGVKTEHRFFKEEAFKHDDYLWGNAAFAFACVSIESFSTTGWFADIKGFDPEYRTGGVINLLRDFDGTDRREHFGKYAVEYALTDKQEKTLSDSGFIPLKDNPMIKRGIFYNVQSVQMAKRYASEAGSANAKISGMLHYIMCANRFAHYIKVIVRDKIGGFMNASDCEDFLQG